MSRHGSGHTHVDCSTVINRLSRSTICKLTTPGSVCCTPLPNLRPGEELSFEEVRGAAWLQRRQVEQAAAVAQQAPRADDDMELDGDTCVLPCGLPPAMLSCARPARPRASPAAAEEVAGLGSPAAVGGPAAPSPAPLASPAAGELEAPAPSPQPAAEEAVPMQPEAAAPLEDEPAAAAAEEAREEQQAADVLLPTPFDLPASAEKPEAAEQPVEAVVAAEPAVAEVAEADEAAHPSAAPASGLQFEAAGGLSEPTITLSTRDAFAAINQMFGVSGCLLSGGGGAD